MESFCGDHRHGLVSCCVFCKHGLAYSINHPDMHLRCATPWETHKNFIPGRIWKHRDRHLFVIIFNTNITGYFDIVDHEYKDIVRNTLDPHIGCLAGKGIKIVCLFSPCGRSRFGPSRIDEDEISRIISGSGYADVELFQSILVGVGLNP